ncbi:MAG: extracellular solute-binding protein [Eubacteriales bacterium]
MKKALWSTLVLLLLTTGCSSTTQSTNQESTETIILTFWHYYAGNVEQQLDAIVYGFNNGIGKEKGIQIETIPYGNIGLLEEELINTAENIIAVDDMPDLFLTYADTALELYNFDVLSNIDDYFTDTDKNKLVQPFLTSGRLYDIQGIIPTVKSTELILMNDTSWNAFANETGKTYEDLSTWEGLFDVAEAYYEYSDGNAFFGIDSLQNFIVIASQTLGCEIFDSHNQEAVLDEVVLQQIFDFYVSCYALGYFTQEGQFRSDDIRTANIVAFTGSSASVAYFPAWIEKNGVKSNISLKALPYPSFEGTTPYVLSQGAGIAMGKTGEDREKASAEFIKYFLDYNVEFAINTAYIPTIQSFFDLSLDEYEKCLTEHNITSSSEQEVYHLVMEQINQELTYQPDAFIGSYDVRIQLKVAFQQAAEQLRVQVDLLREEGMQSSEIVKHLNLDEQFQQTMTVLRQSFDEQYIPYR